MINKVLIRGDSGFWWTVTYWLCNNSQINYEKMKSQIWKKILYLLDNREYTKMRNDDTTSPLVVPTLY